MSKWMSEITTFVLKQSDGNALMISGLCPPWPPIFARALAKSKTATSPLKSTGPTADIVFSLKNMMASLEISACDPADAPFQTNPVLVDFEENTIENLMEDYFSSAMDLDDFISKYTELPEYKYYDGVQGAMGVQGVQGIQGVQGYVTYGAQGVSYYSPAGGSEVKVVWSSGATGATGTTGPTYT